MVVVLNYLYLQTTRPAVVKGVNESQKACLLNLRASVMTVVKEAPEVKPLSSMTTQLKQARFDYAGEPVAVMEELEAAKVIPCWPRPGEAAIQPAINFVPPAMRAMLERPESLLLPQEQWPESPPISRVRASDGEWATICQAAHERKMMVPVRKEDVFKDHQGRPVFNGAMAVVKVKKIGGEDKQLQRFISNLVPGNSYQSHLPGDDVHLPYLGQMAMMSVHPDEELVVDSEDLTSCFNLFSLPRAWAPYMAFGKPVDGSVFGLARGEEVYPAMAVIPMGWLSAVALTQAIVRHLVFDLSGVNPESEIRKTAAFPGEDEFSVIYLDSFDELRKLDRGLAAVTEGQPSENHLAFQATCQRLGLPLNEGKRVVAAARGALQGGEIDGRAGTFFLARDKQAQLIGLTAALLEAEKVTEFELRHWTGKVIFGMSFRRPLMSVLEAVFMDIVRAEVEPVVLSPAAVDEIVAVLALIPLMSMNLRATLDDEVVVTDASPSGGGAAVATKFKREPDTVDYAGDVCMECEGAFGEWGRLPCPSSCGGAFCSLRCIDAHRSSLCVRKEYPFPKFGERFSGPRAPLSHAVAKRGGIQVQEPFDWYRGHDFFNPEDKQRLEAMEDDPLLRAEHWAPECKLMSRARGRPIVLASGRTIKGPQPVRDHKHIMGFPWLSGEMKARLRRSNSMALRGLKRGGVCQSRRILHSVEHPWNSWMWEMKPSKDLQQDSHAFAKGSACCWGGRREKWYGVLTNSHLLMAAINHPDCPGHTGLLDYEVTENPDGSLHYPTEEEAEYPMQFCHAYAEGIHNDMEQQGLFHQAMMEGRLAWIRQELGQSTLRLQQREVTEHAAREVLALERMMVHAQERQHLLALVREASIRGADVRLLMSVNEESHEWPYPAYRWYWQEKLSYPWKQEDHINELELQAFIVMVRRRVRKASRHHSRYLHIVDSAVTRGAVAKGRSTSRRLNRLLRKVAAMTLAADVYPLTAWTISRWNFADLASRRMEVKQKSHAS